MPIQTSAPASNATGMAAEPVMPLPAGPMFAAATLGGIATIVLWFAGSALFESMQGVLPTALAGIGTVVAIYLATTAMLSPWKARRMGDWMTFWLGATVVRLMVTPIAAWVLYSAALRDVRTLGLAVALSYVLCLFLETGTLAWFLNRRLASTDDSTSTPAASEPGHVRGADQP